MEEPGKRNGLKKERRIFEAKCGDTVYSLLWTISKINSTSTFMATDITELKKWGKDKVTIACGKL